MELEDKYLVLKRADIEAALNGWEQGELFRLVNSIKLYRYKQGKKPDNQYVVINQDEPYFPDVLKLMEVAENAGMGQAPGMG